MAKKFTLVLIPGDIEPLEKSGNGNHPASLSSAKHKGKSFGNIDTNNPDASHRETMTFAKMAAERMLEAIQPKPKDSIEGGTPIVDHKGREAGQKKPHSNYSDSASGMKSKAHNNYGKRTYVVDPKEIGSSTPESAKEHQPRKVPKPKK